MLPEARADIRSARMKDSAAARSPMATAPLPSAGGPEHPGPAVPRAPGHLLSPRTGVRPSTMLSEHRGLLCQQSGFFTPGCFLPCGFSSAKFLQSAGNDCSADCRWVFPKPNPASYAHLLVVKCTEATLPSGICFLTKPAEPVAHKTWVLSSNEAPCGFS